MILGRYPLYKMVNNGGLPFIPLDGPFPRIHTDASEVQSSTAGRPAGGRAMSNLVSAHGRYHRKQVTDNHWVALRRNRRKWTGGTSSSSDEDEDEDDDGDGQSSVSSPGASSSFSSGRRFSDVDYFRDRPLQSEVEEIPSFRWLMTPRSQPVPKPPPEPPSEVDWGHLASAQGKHRLNQVTANTWVVLVEGGTIEERCALVLAPGLEIKWRDEERSCWRYHAGAAVLRKACWLDIRAKVDAADLFRQTACVSVLVFQLLPTAFGLGLGGETQEAWIAVRGRLASERTVRLQPGASSDVAGGGGPRQRRDGWLEIELGEFSAATYAGVGEALVEMGLREVERVGQAKGGLVVRGVEVRPKHLTAAAGEGEETVRVSATLCPQWALPELDAEPFDVGGSWMLSCWLAPIAVTRRLSGGRSELFPDQILRRSYADWIPRDLDPTPLELKLASQLRTGGLRSRFTRAAS